MTEHDESKNEKLKPASHPKERRSYTKPQLTEFGHIKKMTEGPAASGPDQRASGHDPGTGRIPR
jgi:hypothetical protein